MKFFVTYHRDKSRKGKRVRESEMDEMGNWRSRWERKRDLDRLDPKKDHITRIFTKPTPKDYIVTEVHGVSPDNLYFKAVPMKSAPKPKKKNKGGADLVAVHKESTCKTCGNYIGTVKKRNWHPAKSFYHNKKKK